MSSIVAIFVFQSYSDPDSNEPNHIAIRYTHHVGTEDGAAQQIASKLACANEERLPIATSWDACIVDAVSVETLPPSAQACVERVLINNETSDAYLVRRLRDASARSEFRKAQLVGTREMFSDLRREVLNIKSQRIKTIDRDVQRAKKKLTKLNVILRYEVVNRLIKGKLQSKSLYSLPTHIIPSNKPRQLEPSVLR
ncbi:hypothetical protein DFH09DRAFT_1193605 [Mycena vulgaris]|nr:hypothetical protein DFH09DRAFT_1193605 [Mycena vulgaris]